MKTLLKSLFYVSLLYFSVAAKALVVDTLYEQDLLVEDKSSELRITRSEEAFRKLLMQISGTSDALNHERVQQALTQVDRYISKYSYHELPNQMLQLRLSFDIKMVQQMLQKAGFSYLGKNRPVTVLWLALDSPSEPELVGGALQNQMTSHLEALSVERGLPIILPLMDLTDKAVVSDKDIWSFTEEPLIAGSKRYEADLVLTAKITQLANEWHAQWMLSEGQGETQLWEMQKTSLDELLVAAANQFGEKVSTLYNKRSLVEPTAEKIQVAVSGIDSIEDYGTVLGYLEGLEAITQVDVSVVEASQTVFNLYTYRGQEAIKNSLGFDKVLVLEQSNKETDELSLIEPKLNYKLRASR